MFFALLLSGGFLLAQDSGPSAAGQDDSKASNGQITVRGCVSRSSGDYVLLRQDPGMTYGLRTTGKTKIGHYDSYPFAFIRLFVPNQAFSLIVSH